MIVQHLRAGNTIWGEELLRIIIRNNERKLRLKHFLVVNGIRLWNNHVGEMKSSSHLTYKTRLEKEVSSLPAIVLLFDKHCSWNVLSRI